jgi:hypothetical protein
MTKRSGRNANGPPSYYAASAADGVQGLAQAINQAVAQFTNQCVLQLGQPLQDLARVDVAIDCTVLPRRSSDGGAGDWYLSFATNPPTVVLQGAACDYARSRGTERVHVILGCSGG